MKTLVAGVGNVFLGDDGFGVEVVRRLATDTLPNGTRVADFGIRGLHLAYHLLDGFDTLILVDAMARGKEPGTLYVFEPEPDAPARASIDAHGLDPASVLATVRALGGTIGKTIVVGCEPATLEEGMGLSAPVERAVEEAADLVRRILATQEGRA
jgi:hydrogenase maturation protease